MSSGFNLDLRGDWDKAKGALAVKLKPLIREATLQEAALGERIMKRFITDAGGKGWVAPLSPWTVASRKLSRPAIKGTKPLIARGDMRNSITHKVSGGQAFVGILKAAKSKDGKSLHDLAALHEKGKTIVIRITPKMRRFMAILARTVHGGSKKGGSGGGGKQFLVVHIPARPFIGPSFEMWMNGSSPAMVLYKGMPAGQRMLIRVGKRANKRLGDAEKK